MFTRKFAINALRRPMGQLAIRAFSGHGPPPLPEGFYSQHCTPVCTRTEDHPTRVRFLNDIDFVREQMAIPLSGQKKHLPHIWINTFIGLALGLFLANVLKNKYNQLFMLMETWSLMSDEERGEYEEKLASELSAWNEKYPFMHDGSDDAKERLVKGRIGCKVAESYLASCEDDDDDDDDDF